MQGDSLSFYLVLWPAGIIATVSMQSGCSRDLVLSLK